MSRRRTAILGVFMLCLLLAVGSSVAQDNSTCPALVEEALTDIGSNCNAVDRNNVCYGFNRVDSAFFQPQPEGFFSVPADRAGLSEVESIQTTPLDSADQLWGVAVMNVQANVPGGLPGQAAVFLLYGDVQVDNAVSPDQAFIPGSVVNVKALVTANGRSGPGTNYNVVIGIPINAEMSADALNEDGTWVRVLYNDSSAWVSRTLVQPEVSGALDGLPKISAAARSPMQAIHLKTGFNSTECLTAPSVLVVQGPEHVRVDISVNGANIRIGSTIALRTTPDGFLQLITLHGVAVVDGIQVPPGFTIQIKLTPDGLGIVGSWEGLRPLNGDELQALKWLEGTPPNLLHYAIVLPSLGDIAQILAAINRPTGSSGSGPGGSGSGGAACAGFVPTSPLGGANTGPNTFYWNPAPGADSYHWVLYDINDLVLASGDTAQTNYSHTLQPTYSASLSWEVHALAGGREICVSDRIPLDLHGGGQFPPPSQSQDNGSSGINDARSCRAAGGVWDPVKGVCNPG